VRVAAISDIHGNLPALEAVLADVERVGVDGIVVVGDTLSGPWPVEAFELVTTISSHVVSGNADREVVERGVQFGPLATWCADRLGEERLATAAAAWPLTRELELEGLGRVLVCHATPDSDEPIHTRITPERELLRLLGDVEADVVLCGHTHMQYERRLSTGLRVVNPGSVGMPYEGRAGAYWALLGPDVEFRRTEYDAAAAAAAIRKLGAPVDEQLLVYLVDPPSAEETTAYFESLRGA
jgi:putative phosphoesterase